MQRQFDIRLEFAKVYGNARAAHRRGVLAPDLLRLATATLRTACYRLVLPRLKPDERARMTAADVPGIQELMLALDGTLSSFPELCQALSLASSVMAELQNKDVDLHTAVQRATAITLGASCAERSAGAQLKELSAQVINSASRLQDDPAASEPAKEEASDILAAVSRFDVRIDRAQKRRQQRLRRRIEFLTTSAAETTTTNKLEPHHVIAARSPSLLPTSDEAPSDPGPGPRSPEPRAHEPADEIFPEIAGAPLDQCLQATPSTFEQAKDQLADIADLLKDDQPADGPEDYLYYIELGALLASALRRAPLVQAACKVEPAHLAALCAQADDSALLGQTSQLFTRMASDGHLYIAAFTILLYEHTTSWLKERAAEPARSLEERQLLEVEALRLQQIYGRARERIADRKARNQGQLNTAQAEVTAAQKKANLDRVKDRLNRGLPVDAQTFFAAEAAQKELHHEDLARTSEAMSRAKTPPAPARKGRRDRSR